MLAACGDSFTVQEIAGDYALGSVEGQVPPYLEAATVECDQWIAGGDLALRPDETYTLTLEIEVDCNRNGGPVEQESRVYSGGFALTDDRLELDWSPPAGSAETFGGRVRGSAVDVALPWQVAALDPFMDLRFNLTAVSD